MFNFYAYTGEKVREFINRYYNDHEKCNKRALSAALRGTSCEGYVENESVKLSPAMREKAVHENNYLLFRAGDFFGDHYEIETHIALDDYMWLFDLIVNYVFETYVYNDIVKEYTGKRG